MIMNETDKIELGHIDIDAAPQSYSSSPDDKMDAMDVSKGSQSSKNDEPSQPSEVVDKSSIFRKSHYTAGSSTANPPFEGGRK